MSESLSLSKKIHKSLEACWKEGVSANLMMGILDYYLIPYALFLGASTKQIGYLSSLPHLLAAFALLVSTREILRSGSRLLFLKQGMLLQATLLLPVALLVFTPFLWKIEILIVLIVLHRVLNNLMASAWGSLVSEYLPPEKRGLYFGWRSQITGAAGLIGVGCAGLTLFFMKKISHELAFFTLFSAAALFRFICIYYISQMVDLPLHHSKEHHFTFLMFLKRFKESNFVKFILFVAAITFATHIAAPYFSVYMLRDLKFNYATYMCVHIATIMGGLIAFPIWGKHADVVGNAKILKITGALIPLIPLFWLFSSNIFYLVAVEAVSGFIWGGFNLCVLNFIYESVTPPKRVRCLSYFNLIIGVAIFLGATLGGYLAEHLPPLKGFSILTLFLLSAMLRMLAHLFSSKHFREVRTTHQKVSSLRLMSSVIGIRRIF